MMHIKKAEFTRVIPSDGQLFGEVKVWPADGSDPMLAWFVKGNDGCLQMSKLIRKNEEIELDWYDNSLHHAFEDVTDSWFERETSNGCRRTDFEQEVLDFGSVGADLEERMWKTGKDLASGVNAAAYAPDSDSPPSTLR